MNASVCFCRTSRLNDELPDLPSRNPCRKAIATSRLVPPSRRMSLHWNCSIVRSACGCAAAAPSGTTIINVIANVRAMVMLDPFMGWSRVSADAAGHAVLIGRLVDPVGVVLPAGAAADPANGGADRCADPGAAGQ